MINNIKNIVEKFIDNFLSKHQARNFYFSKSAVQPDKITNITSSVCSFSIDYSFEDISSHECIVDSMTRAYHLEAAVCGRYYLLGELMLEYSTLLVAVFATIE